MSRCSCWIALIVAAMFGWAPMIAVQPAFYAELFGARVRYTGFATSRELGRGGRRLLAADRRSRC